MRLIRRPESTIRVQSLLTLISFALGMLGPQVSVRAAASDIADHRAAYLRHLSEANGSYDTFAQLAFLGAKIREAGGPEKFAREISKPGACLSPTTRDTQTCIPSGRELFVRSAKREGELANAFRNISTPEARLQDELQNSLDFLGMGGKAVNKSLQAAKRASDNLEYNKEGSSIRLGSTDLKIADDTRAAKQALVAEGLRHAEKHPVIKSLVEGMGPSSVNGTVLMRAGAKDLEHRSPGYSKFMPAGSKVTEKQKQDQQKETQRRDHLFAKMGNPSVEQIHSISPKDLAARVEEAVTRIDQEKTARNEKAQRYQELGQAVELVAQIAGDNKSVRAVAEIAKTGLSIAAITALAGPGVAVGWPIFMAVAGLAGTLKHLFGPSSPPGPSDTDLILTAIGKLENQMASARSTFANARVEDRALNAEYFEKTMDLLKSIHSGVSNLRAENRQAHLDTQTALQGLVELLKNYSDEGRLEKADAQLTAMEGHANMIAPLSFALTKKGHDEENGFIKNKERAKEILTWTMFEKSTSEIRKIGRYQSVGPSAQMHRRWDPTDTGKSPVKMMAIAEALKTHLNLDISVTPPPSANLIQLKRPENQKEVVSPDTFSLWARAEHAIQAPTHYPSTAVNEAILDYQCQSDPKLARIKEALDLGVIQRDQFYQSIPSKSDGSFEVTHLIKAVSLYEDALDTAIKSVGGEGDLGSCTSTGELKTEFGNYDIAKPLAQQPFDFERAGSPHFLFPAAPTIEIRSCGPVDAFKNSAGKETLLQPPLAVSESSLVDFAKSGLIHPDILKARDVLGGTFSWCYDELGIDDEEVSLSNSGGGQFTGVHSGRPGVTLRVTYRPAGQTGPSGPSGPSGSGGYDVASVRISDRRGPKTQFFSQRYTEVINGSSSMAFNLNQTALDPSALDESEGSRTFKSRLASSTAGTPELFPLGAKEAVDPRLGVVWDRRFTKLAEDWRSPDFQRLLLQKDSHDSNQISVVPSWQNKAQTTRNPKDKTGKIIDLARREADTRQILLAEAQRRLSDMRFDLKKCITDQLKAKVGNVTTNLGKLDAARERILQLLWFAFGDGVAQNETLRQYALLLTDASRIRELALNPEWREHLLRPEWPQFQKARDSDLIHFLVNPKSALQVQRNHAELDDAIQKLTELYWKRFLVDKKCVKSRADLPLALQKHFANEKSFQWALNQALDSKTPGFLNIADKRFASFSPISYAPAKTLAIYSDSRSEALSTARNGFIMKTLSDYPDITPQDLFNMITSLESTKSKADASQVYESRPSPLVQAYRELLNPHSEKRDAALVAFTGDLIALDNKNISQEEFEKRAAERKASAQIWDQTVRDLDHSTPGAAMSLLAQYPLDKPPTNAEIRKRAELAAWVKTNAVAPDLKNKMVEALGDFTPTSQERLDRFQSLAEQRAQNLEKQATAIAEVRALKDRWTTLQARYHQVKVQVNQRFETIKDAKASTGVNILEYEPADYLNIFVGGSIGRGIRERIKELGIVEGDLGRSVESKQFEDLLVKARAIDDRNDKERTGVPVVLPNDPKWVVSVLGGTSEIKDETPVLRLHYVGPVGGAHESTDPVGNWRGWKGLPVAWMDTVFWADGNYEQVVGSLNDAERITRFMERGASSQKHRKPIEEAEWRAAQEREYRDRRANSTK